MTEMGQRSQKSDHPIGASRSRFASHWLANLYRLKFARHCLANQVAFRLILSGILERNKTI